jgi:sorbitol-specific phosphotransferase system component IIC
MGHTFERVRFAVYVLVPILSVVIFSNPTVYEHAIKSHAYVVYKYNPAASPLYHARNKAAAAAAAAPLRAVAPPPAV